MELFKTKPVTHCPYCNCTGITKKGKRKKKYETVQLYFCNHCQRKFTPVLNKNRSFPLRIIIDSIGLYNRMFSIEDSARLVSETYGIPVSPQNISNWIKDFKKHFPFLKFRNEIKNCCDPRRMLIEARFHHRQIYDFKFHRGKWDFLLEKYDGFGRFSSLGKYLSQVPSNCPNRYFKDSQRSSKSKPEFDLDEVEIKSIAKDLTLSNAQFLLQSVGNNNKRHQFLQEFMILNDLATVAVEIPVFLFPLDLEYFEEECGFKIPDELLKKRKVITGHIDIVQIRNGKIHILDYKPGAKKEKPIEQLTIYALALSRLAGLKLRDLKCGWFDDENYYEFYPLQVVHKLKK